MARGTTAITPAVRKSAAQLSAVALRYVQEESGAVRVEDYVAVLATLTGEAALVAADLFDIETSTITPGAPVFGDAINRILSGDQADVAKCPADSVVGILVSELVPATVPLDLFGPLDRFYAWVAESVGKAAWGNVTTSVAAGNKPRIMPVRVAFELRGAVDAAQSKAGLARDLRHVVCAVALAECLKQVKLACDMTMAVTLAMEVAFGTAKMAPMSRAAFETVAGSGGEQQPQ
ncbi:MAG: hypothetical protein ACXWM8_02715 [Candidatus Limnocylindrales bacterium]